MSGSGPALTSAISQLQEAPLYHSEPATQISFVKRAQHLGILLWVSLSMPIVRSTYYLITAGSTHSYTPLQQRYRLIATLIEQASALLLLRYVMGRQGKTRKDIGWEPHFADVLRAVGLFVAAIVAELFVYYQTQYLYYAHSGHYLTGRSLHSLLGFGVSALSIAYACLNPFTEELIVRGYTISEVLNLGGSRTIAVVISVVVQLSYHLYQGPINVLWLMPIFVVFSIYYVRSRRILPIIIAHLAMDLLALVRGQI